MQTQEAGTSALEAAGDWTEIQPGITVRVRVNRGWVLSYGGNQLPIILEVGEHEPLHVRECEILGPSRLVTEKNVIDDEGCMGNQAWVETTAGVRYR